MSPAKGTMRLQKVLANLGVASRRAVEQMVLEGRISVNSEVVTKSPCFVNIDVDEIRVDGTRVKSAKRSQRAYYLLNKPTGVVCTQNDPDGRTRAVDMIPPELTRNQRIYCVGRLDIASTGLILLTNDGDLTEYLTHPKHGVEKHYHVEIQGELDENDIAQLKKGVYVDGKRTAGAAVKVLRRGRVRSMLQIQLREGRNREIRRVMARLGHKVYTLNRISIGPIGIRGLKVGNWRELTIREVDKLRSCGGKTEARPDLLRRSITKREDKSRRPATTSSRSAASSGSISKPKPKPRPKSATSPKPKRSTKGAPKRGTSKPSTPRRGAGRNATQNRKGQSGPKGKRR